MARRASRVAAGAALMCAVAACSGSDGDATTPLNTDSAADATTTVGADLEPTTSRVSEPATTTTSTTTLATPSTSTTTSPAGQPDGETLRVAIETSLVTGSGRTTLDERMAELLVPGVAVVVVADGEPVLALAAGVTPDGSPMSTDSVLQVGSVSKPVAAVAAASLAAAGSLSWDGPVTDQLTSYDLPLGSSSPDEVTIARLLSHTGGTNVDGFLGYASSDVAPALSELLAGDGDSEAVAVVLPPGRAPTYSGGGYEIVEQAILDATDAASFDDVVRRTVFQPAAMGDSFYALEPDDSVIDRISVGSVNGDALENGWQRHPENAAAGLWTTADDLGRFLAAFNASLSGDDQTLLPTVWSNRLVEPVAPFDPFGPNVAVGTGWFLDDVSEPRTYRHGGRNVGYTAEIAGTIDGRFGVVVVTNSFPGGASLAQEIIGTVSDQQSWS